MTDGPLRQPPPSTVRSPYLTAGHIDDERQPRVHGEAQTRRSTRGFRPRVCPRTAEPGKQEQLEPTFGAGDELGVVAPGTVGEVAVDEEEDRSELPQLAAAQAADPGGRSAGYR